MKNHEFDFVLDSTIDAIVCWIDFFQEDFETESLYYFVKTQSVTEESAIYYYLCHDKTKHEQTQKYRNYSYFSLLPEEVMIGTLTIIRITNGVRIFGKSIEGSSGPFPWAKFASKLMENYPGLTKYSESQIMESSDVNNQATDIGTQVENRSENELVKSEETSIPKNSSSGDDLSEVVVEIARLKSAEIIKKPLEYDYYAVVRWNRRDEINSILAGIYNVYHVPIKAERLRNRMSELRKLHPELNIIKRNEVKC